MTRTRPLALFALAALAGLAACDNDPTVPTEAFALQACPSGRLNVNEPILLNFSVPVLPSSVTGANVVVTDATTGIEVPGTVALASNGTQVRFTPSSRLQFDKPLQVRVQNLLSVATSTQLPVTLCVTSTALPPITELFWQRLPNAGGDILRGVSLVGPDEGYVMSELGVLFKRKAGSDFLVQYKSPYFSAGFDVAFANATRGIATFDQFRVRRATIMQTLDGGLNFDSLGFINQQTAQRIYFKDAGQATGPFSVIGGGNTGQAIFAKFHPENNTFTLFTDNSTGYPNDVDFAAGDTTKGASATNGIKVGTFDVRGEVFTSSNGGATWTVIPGSAASAQTQTYFGVAVRKNGDVFVSGGSGYFARWTKSAAGTWSSTPLLVNAVTNPDVTNPLALVYTDVQFAPDNDLVGWVIGAQLVGLIGDVPRYQGLIFMTRDGGATWTRQGVKGAENYGAEFPRLNRMSVFSSSAAWLVGDAGVVFRYNP
ncbi:MAG: Photosynthesis system assembly factor [Gemmatimonadetes bacterium]|nr:Photosynthesis system assembly factor [Gemmatimonadota bacterium]